MKSIDVIRNSLQMADGGFVGLVKGLRDYPMTRSSGSIGNHAVWTLGHLAFLELAVPSILFGKLHPKPEWEPLFRMGSECLDDASKYPSFDELLSTYQSVRAANLKLLDEVGDARLEEKPAAIPPGFESHMATFGKTFAIFAIHQMFHMGQVADMRRVAGLPRNQ